MGMRIRSCVFPGLALSALRHTAIYSVFMHSYHCTRSVSRSLEKAARCVGPCPLVILCVVTDERRVAHLYPMVTHGNPIAAPTTSLSELTRSSYRLPLRDASHTARAAARRVFTPPSACATPLKGRAWPHTRARACSCHAPAAATASRTLVSSRPTDCGLAAASLRIVLALRSMQTRGRGGRGVGAREGVRVGVACVEVALVGVRVS